VIDVDWHWRRLAKRHGIRGWELAVATAWPGRWVRLGAFWGEAPGSVMYGKHWTVWHTDCGRGQVHGWNLRAGWWPRPCLTLLAHTRPEHAYDLARPGPVWAQACAESGWRR
jgi:hypothetical protein